MSDASSDRPAQADHLKVTAPSEFAVFTKEECDIAFAAELLASGVLTDHELAVAAASWRIRGNVTLADELSQADLITAQQRNELEDRAGSRLKELADASADDKRETLDAGGTTRNVLERLDESGRIAKTLGISNADLADNADTYREHVSRYELVRRLGQGGLGNVWLARDKNLQRYVALKEIRYARGANKKVLDRFHKEAEITGRLEHPAIVPIYQLGEDATSGEAFYAMRFLGKRSLQDSIDEYHERSRDGDEDPMLLRHQLTAFVTVCQAIGHAHSRRVIHRDLKPENVAIDSFGQVIVIDWGLAKVLDETVASDAAAEAALSDHTDVEDTLDGQVLGSPLFMAPEQAAGQLDEVDERTDIYGLGGILFSILTGCAPHDKSYESSESKSIKHLIKNIASGPTPLASDANPDVDPVLEAICAKAMAQRRNARYDSAMAVAEDVQRWMAGETVTAYRESISQRIGRWIRNNRRLSQYIAVAVVVALVAGTSLAIVAQLDRIAAEQARFEQLRFASREIEVQVVAMAEDLGRDVRFMSTLPTLQALNGMRSDQQAGDDEAVWRDRLAVVFEGLLQTNPDYLSVTYLEKNADQLKEIVRVERQKEEPGFIRRVPASRLVLLPHTPFTDTMLQTELGDVRLSIDHRLLPSQSPGATRTLAAAAPVCKDVSGDILGLVAIVTDLNERLINILNRLDQRLGEIYVTDSVGNLWVFSHPDYGARVEARDVNVTDAVPAVTKLLSSRTPARYHSDFATFIVQRVQLDPVDVACSLGIVQILLPEDD